MSKTRLSKKFNFFRLMGLVGVFCIAGALGAGSSWGFWDGFWAADKKSEPAGFLDESRVWSGTLSLREVFEEALKVDEETAQKERAVEASRGRQFQAVDAILPKVRYLRTRQEQDAPEAVVSSDGGVGSNLLRRTTPQRKFTLTQPLFNGFKEIAALKGGSADLRSRQQDESHAKALLFLDVMETYFGYLEFSRDAKILEEVSGVTRRRLGVLQERSKLGRSRDSEVETARADLKLLEADLAASRRQAVLYRQKLEFWVERPIEADLAESEPQASWLEETPVEIPEVAAAAERTKLAESELWVAKSGFFPEVKLDGNYYTERVGFQSGIDWDLLLTVDVPVFDFVQVYGKTFEAQANLESARLGLKKARRMAALELRHQREGVRAWSEEVRAMGEAAEAAKRNYEIQEKEYEWNLVNNLQVLDALRQYQNQLRRHNGARLEEIRSRWRLLAALGRLEIWVNETAGPGLEKSARP